MNKYIQLILTVFVCSFPLLLLGIHNDYPLVTSDSGAYINNAFTDGFPTDRTIFYSYFIKYSSLKYSLWLTVFAQSFLLSFLIVHFNKFVFELTGFVTNLLLMTVYVLLTGVGWYTAQIMPDIFTAILVLAGVLFLVADKPVRYFFLGLFFVSLLMHLSHVLIAVLMSGVLFLFLIFKKQVKFGSWMAYNMAILMAIVLVGYSNYRTSNGFVLSSTSHVFLMGKMSESGVLEKYLTEVCPKENYKLCVYKDELPEHAWDFVWSSGGAFEKTGGWDSSKTEYTQILNGIVSSPKFLGLTIRETFYASLLQFCKLDVGDGLFVYLDNTNPFWKVQENFQREFETYKKSKQNTEELHWDGFNTFYSIVFVLLLLSGLFLLYRNGLKRLFYSFLLVILFLYFNALVTGGLANILSRLNSRAIWIICMFNINLVYSFVINRVRYEKINSSNHNFSSEF